MLSLNENFPERKKGEPICLKTNLKNITLPERLRTLKRQSVTELINKPHPKSKKFSISSFAGAMRKGILNTSQIMRGQDLNRTEADLTPFNTMEVLTEPNFQNSLNSSRSSNKTARSRQNTFKMLIKEDYTGYIKILKRIYPSFKFNHYNRISNEYLEYFKKYGEEGDINNRNFRPVDINQNKNKEYKKSNLLDILGTQEKIEVEPELFKIKKDFLSRSDPYEINMIKEDLSFKTGVIDKELNHILQSQANQLYNYIEKNIDLTKLVEKYYIEIKNKKEYQKKIYKSYTDNSINLLLKENKKKQIINLLVPLKILNELRKKMIELEYISSSNNDNKIKQISDSTNIAKEKIRLLKKYNHNQKNSLIIEVENKIANYESQGEENLNDQFAENVEKLIQLCLIYDKEHDLTKNENSENNENKNPNNRILDKKQDNNKNLVFNEKDYELIISNEKENIYIKYLLIYNNSDSIIKINKLLMSILDMFEIIIKDNMDISAIVEVFKVVFKKIITKNFELVENKSINKLTNIEIISNCYSNILSNYSYIIQLIQSNFGLNVKIFNEVTLKIKNEMDELVKCLILAYLHEIIYENENDYDWKYFLFEMAKVKEKAQIYIDSTKLNWNLAIENSYNEYFSNFDEYKTRELSTKLDNLTWVPINISAKFQEIFNVLYDNQYINKLQIKPEEIIEDETNNENNNEKNENEFLILKNEKNEEDKKHKISSFSYYYIKYIYEYLIIYLYAPNSSLKTNILDKIYKVTKDTLSSSSDFIMNAQKTEKETALYYSDLIIIEECIKKYSPINTNTINDNYQEVIDMINDLQGTCKDNIRHLIKDCVSQFIETFNNLNFKNYPVFDDGKTFNDYVKKLTILKRLYDNMFNCFTHNDINELFKKEYDIMVNEFQNLVISKGIIEDDKQLKQFRKELLYLKKVFQLFTIVDTKNYEMVMDDLKVKVNPNKIPKKKKAKKKQGKEDNEDEDN